jgi:hypothetical protein
MTLQSLIANLFFRLISLNTEINQRYLRNTLSQKPITLCIKGCFGVFAYYISH